MSYSTIAGKAASRDTAVVASRGYNTRASKILIGIATVASGGNAMECSCSSGWMATMTVSRPRRGIATGIDCKVTGFAGYVIKIGVIRIMTIRVARVQVLPVDSGII